MYELVNKRKTLLSHKSLFFQPQTCAANAPEIDDRNIEDRGRSVTEMCENTHIFRAVAGGEVALPGGTPAGLLKRPAEVNLDGAAHYVEGTRGAPFPLVSVTG